MRAKANKNLKRKVTVIDGNNHILLILDAICVFQTGATAMICACENGHINVVQLLIQARASLDITDNVNRLYTVCVEHIL